MIGFDPDAEPGEVRTGAVAVDMPALRVTSDSGRVALVTVSRRRAPTLAGNFLQAVQEYADRADCASLLTMQVCRDGKCADLQGL